MPYSRFLIPPEKANGAAKADWSPVIELGEELQRVRSTLAMAAQPAGDLLRKIERREALLAARVEQLGRTEQELAEAQARLTQHQAELEIIRATSRWMEQVSVERLRLLRAERQLRLGLETHSEAERQRGEAERQRMAEALARATSESQRLADAVARVESELAARREAERQLRSQLAEALARGEAEAARARSIESSTLWRASSALRRALSSHPGLRRLIKGVARPIVRGLRWGLGRGRNRLADR
jgi:chromosome segregation ATPase